MDREEKRVRHNEQARKWKKSNKEKAKESQRKYRLNNLEKVRKSQRDWQKRNREWVREYVIDRKHKLKKKIIKLLGGKCANPECSIIATEDNICIFDFHHINPEDKNKLERTGNEYLRKRFMKLVLEGKIQLLCANCHRKLHYNEGK